MAPSSSSSSTQTKRRPSLSSSSSSSSSASSSNVSSSSSSTPVLKTKLVPIYDDSPPKRDAVQRACDACRRNKQKCDGLAPCSRCAGKRECAYQTVNKKNYTRLATEMGAKQRKRLRWSRVWDDGEEEEEEKPKADLKVKETVWVKGGKKVAKEMPTPAKTRRGKKVEIQQKEEKKEEEAVGSESESEEEQEEQEEESKNVSLEEKTGPTTSTSLSLPLLLSVHPPTSFPPSHPFSTPSLPPTRLFHHRLSPPPPPSSLSSQLPPRQAISSPPLLPHNIQRPNLITAQCVSSFRSTILPSPIGSTPPPTPFSFTSPLPLSTTSTYLSVPELIVKPPTPIDGSRKRGRREWELEEEERRVERVGGVFQDCRFLPPPIGVEKVVAGGGWSL